MDQRVRDGVIRRTIDKKLKAGVLENGWVSHPDTGVPQGSGVSPLLLNLFLHEVLDTWFENVIKRGRSRKGNWVVKRKTASKRLTRALKRINLWCREHRHAKLGWQHQKLALKVRGHYGYYGITSNFRSLTRFHHGVLSLWRKWVGRRLQRSRIEWERFTRLQKHYPLPKAKIAYGIPRT